MDLWDVMRKYVGERSAIAVRFLCTDSYELQAPTTGETAFSSWSREATFLIGNVCPSFRSREGSRQPFLYQLFLTCFQLKIINVPKGQVWGAPSGL